MNSAGKRFLLVAILLLPVLWGIFNFLVKPVAIELPYYGNKTPVANGDTIFQTIEDFSFVDQNNVVINQDSIKGKITVVNYFFTTCTGVCPRINTSLLYIAKRFEKSSEVKLLSHTVNPETDSVAVLKQYLVDRQWDNNPIWHFLTGNKKKLYDMAEFSYLLIADGASKEEFVHSEKVVVLDGEGHVRGIFNGMGGNMEMKKIEDAIKVLIIEKRANASKEKQ